jgi:hypothetical protein
MEHTSKLRFHIQKELNCDYMQPMLSLRYRNLNDFTLISHHRNYLLLVEASTRSHVKNVQDVQKRVQLVGARVSHT